MSIDDKRQFPCATDAVTPRPNPRLWPVILSIIVFIFLGVASLGLALSGGAVYTDSYSHAADRLWGVLALLDAGFVCLASIAAFLFLFVRNETVWKAAIVLLFLALAGSGVVSWAGFGSLADAKRRGGDWGGLSVATSVIGGIVFPALIGAAACVGGVFLWAVRSSRRMANAAS